MHFDYRLPHTGGDRIQIPTLFLRHLWNGLALVHQALSMVWEICYISTFVPFPFALMDSAYNFMKPPQRAFPILNQNLINQYRPFMLLLSKIKITQSEMFSFLLRKRAQSSMKPFFLSLGDWLSI